VDLPPEQADLGVAAEGLESLFGVDGLMFLGREGGRGGGREGGRGGETSE